MRLSNGATLCALVFLFACQSLSETPLVIAHRGASAVAPENTLAAYRLALEQGAEAAECDVYLSRDGVPFLFHDRTLDRTTNGKGPTQDLDWNEISKLDAGSWKGDAWAGEKVPRLVEFLEFMGGRALAVVEIKPAGITDAVLKVVDAGGLAEADVMIFSFRESVMEDMKARRSRWPRTWLVSGKKAKPANRARLFTSIDSLNLDGLGFDRRTVDADLVRRAHARGLKVFVWTVNDPEEARGIAALGVDAIISDRPRLIREALINSEE